MKAAEEDQFRIMIDKIPTLAWSCRPDGSTEFLNQRWLDYTGLTSEQAAGWGWTVPVHPDELGKLTGRVEEREREAKLAQAQENLERLKESVSVQIERSYNKVERTRNMLMVASEVVTLRAEGERLAENQMAQGVVLVSARRQASAASYKAQADLLQAQLTHLLARAELEQTAGRTPGP